VNVVASGLEAATQRLSDLANNVANATMPRPVSRQDSTRPDGAFAPQRTVQTSIPGGGVRAEGQSVEPSTVTGPDNSSPTGLISFSNVNFLEEYLDQKLAIASYKANAFVIRW